MTTFGNSCGKLPAIFEFPKGKVRGPSGPENEMRMELVAKALGQASGFKLLNLLFYETIRLPAAERGLLSAFTLFETASCMAACVGVFPLLM